VPASAGPAEEGPSTQLWLYRSTVDVVRDTQAGLAGPLIVARPGGLSAEGKPADVDREMYMMLQVGRCYVSNMLHDMLCWCIVGFLCDGPSCSLMTLTTA
jgi:hypothetical protein